MKTKTHIQLSEINQPITIIRQNEEYFMRVDHEQLYFKIPELTYEILINWYNNESISNISKFICQRTNESVDEQHVEHMYEHVINHIKDRIAKSQSQKKRFWCCLPIVPEKLVILLGNYLSACFYPPVSLVLVSFIVAMQTNFLFLIHHQSIANTDVIWTGMLFIISAVFHEIGHASACQRFNIYSSEIGLTVHYMIPYFYCSTNGLSLLKKHERMVVDIAGIYFQLIVASIYCGLFHVTHWQPLISAVSMILFCCLICMLPLFKTDGYWFFNDCFANSKDGE